MKAQLTLIFSLIFITTRTISAQLNATNELAEKYENTSINAAPELVYIQTSKDIYETGEDLWFKAYVLNSQTFSPSTLSKTLYLQLINEKTKESAWQEKYEINDGFSDGRILLRENLEEGIFLIQAFTANSYFADSSQFTAFRRIKVVNDISNLGFVRTEFEKPDFITPDSVKLKLMPLIQNDTSAIQISISFNQGGQNTNVLQTKMVLDKEKHLSFKTSSIEKGSLLIVTTKYKNHTEELILSVPGKANPVQFNLFPEGGSLVAGIKSKIAFKAVAINGEPINVKGLLYKNDSVYLEFTSSHAGMGFFELKPSINEKYYIKLQEPATDSIYTFPEVEPEGMTLRLLSRDRDYLNFQVSKVSDGHQDKIYLLSQIRGIIYGLSELSLQEDLRIKIPLVEMPQGIAEITLFNENLEPVAERLVYVNPQKKIKIQTNLSDSIVPTRGKVNLKIIATDENNEPVKANLALSVFDRIYESQIDSIDILTHMYLSTQLKGRIYNPGHYFNEQSTNRMSELDLLLLTQGWRRYIWNKANLNSNVGNNTVISDEIIGNAYLAYPTRKNKISKEQVIIVAYAPDRDSIKKLITANADGNFRISPILLSQWNGAYIYLRPLTSSKSTIHLELINQFDIINHVLSSKEISVPVYPRINEMQIPELKIEKTGTTVIKDVVIKGRSKGVIRGKYMGALDSLAVDINTDYVCRYDILNCRNHPREWDNRKPIEGEKLRLVGLDGVKEIIYHHEPLQRNYSEDDLLKIFNLYRTKGYYGISEYYHPIYDKDFEFTSIPDYRNTLTWQANILTNDKGEASVSFFCSDLNTDFTGRIEGVGGTDLLGVGGFKLTVRKLQFERKK